MSEVIIQPYAADRFLESRDLVHLLRDRVFADHGQESDQFVVILVNGDSALVLALLPPVPGREGGREVIILSRNTGYGGWGRDGRTLVVWAFTIGH